MVNTILKRMNDTYQQFLNLKEFFMSVMNGELKKRDEEMNKRFEQHAKKDIPGADLLNPKMESMTHSQGAANLASSGYKGTGKAAPAKGVINKPRNVSPRHA